MRSLILLAAILAGCAAPRDKPLSEAPPSLHVGQVALANGEPAIAASVANNQLARTPGAPDALLLRADAEAAMGQSSQAGADYRQLLGARPASVGAALGLARLLMATDPAAADALLGPVAARGDATAAVWNNLGVARDLLGRHADAQAAYRQALAADASMQSAQVNLARSLSLTPAGRP